MFGNKPLSLGRVYDTVKITEGGETLVLHVNNDPNIMVVGLNEAKKRLERVNDKSSIEEQTEAARFISGIIFGDEQTQKLFDFYYCDPMCVISIVSKYFSERLADKITKAQKKK